MKNKGIENYMEDVQKQVVALSNKVEALYQVVEHLNQNVSEALSANKQKQTAEVSNTQLEANKIRQYSGQNYSSFEPTMQHKDVLVDNKEFDKNAYQSSEKELAPEIQIQRLTAQLTAAYNRIASLEEQLLARRIHS